MMIQCKDVVMQHVCFYILPVKVLIIKLFVELLPKDPNNDKGPIVLGAGKQGRRHYSLPQQAYKQMKTQTSDGQKGYNVLAQGTEQKIPPIILLLFHL